MHWRFVAVNQNPFRDANPLEGVLNKFLPKAHKILVWGLLKNVNVGPPPVTF